MSFCLTFLMYWSYRSETRQMQTLQKPLQDHKKTSRTPLGIYSNSLLVFGGQNKCHTSVSFLNRLVRQKMGEMRCSSGEMRWGERCGDEMREVVEMWWCDDVRWWEIRWGSSQEGLRLLRSVCWKLPRKRLKSHFAEGFKLVRPGGRQIKISWTFHQNRANSKNFDASRS